VKTLLLGLGNPILCDDGVGIHVVRAVAARGLPDGVDCAEASVGGLRLLETIAGYQRVVMVDAIQIPGGQPGAIHRLRPDDLHATLHTGSSHDLSLAAALALGRGLGLLLPADENLLIVAVQAADVLTFAETCTPAVAAAIPRAVEAVLAVLAEDGQADG
jgi:hydrogenase maturation protease